MRKFTRLGVREHIGVVLKLLLYVLLLTFVVLWFCAGPISAGTAITFFVGALAVIKAMHWLAMYTPGTILIDSHFVEVKGFNGTTLWKAERGCFVFETTIRRNNHLIGSLSKLCSVWQIWNRRIAVHDGYHDIDELLSLLHSMAGKATVHTPA
jgi:hypothetical protein